MRTREIDQFHERGDAQFFKDSRLVAADRLVADEQRVRNFLIAQTTGQVLQDRQFTIGKLSSKVPGFPSPELVRSFRTEVAKML